jgi:photosystem II stability/assembly factor-like uncharacterized protein
MPSTLFTAKTSILLFAILIMSYSSRAQWVPFKVPFGGKVTSLAIDGSSLYAGTWGGGIYLSENSGDQWNSINTGLPANALVISLAAFKGGLYACISTSPGYSSVYSTINHGNTWKPFSMELPSNPYVYSLSILDTCIFAGTNKGIFVSNAQGKMWKAANEGLPSNVYVYAITGNEKELFAGTWESGLYKSIDKGKTWQEANSGLPLHARIYSLAMAGSRIYAGTNGGVFLSVNKGETWSFANSGLSNVFVCALAISENSVYAGSNQVYKRDILAEVNNIQPVQDGIELVPNPSNGFFYVQSNEAEDNITELFITNMEGVEIYRIASAVSSRQVVDISFSSKGFYLLHLQTKKGMNIKKIVIQ